MASPVRVAVDLLGGDTAPDAVIDGAILAADADPDVVPILIGPADLAQRALRERDAADRFAVITAEQVVTMDEHPTRAVRAKRDATVRVAARVVRDGDADALVSIGSTGATMAAATFTFGRLPGVTRPSIAIVVPALHGPVVLLDVGANADTGPELLAQFALAGAAYARARLDLPRPRVGLLSIGAESGKGDALRKRAYDALAIALDGLPAEFVGNVEGDDVPVGGRADVVVTDGFTGNVLLKGMEGMVVRLQAAAGDGETFTEGSAPLQSDEVGGAIVLGVDGVAVVGHGAASGAAAASCIRLAADAVRADLVANVSAGLGELVAKRRAAAGARG